MSNGQQELNPHPQRTFLGMPVNWDWKNWNKGFWNAQDHRLFPPKRVGIGWTINLRELLRRLRILP
jgi:uncharacterized membrane protein